MAFDFNGYVLKGVRVSPSNAQTTSEPTNGVVRDIQLVPEVYDLATTAPGGQLGGGGGGGGGFGEGAHSGLVDVYGTMYRTAVLSAPGSTPVEYLLWAANTSNLALVDDPTWWVSTGAATVPAGSLSVGEHTDGSDHVIVTDTASRDISRVLWLVLARGDQEYTDGGWRNEADPSEGRLGPAPYAVLQVDADLNPNPSNGVVHLSSGQLVFFGGALSKDRGDRIIEVRYVLSASRFYWTRNDRYQTRFGWSDRTQRWEPHKGNTPINLGKVDFDTVYDVLPKPRGLKVGFTLPGDAENPDSFALLRLGTTPGSLSTPLAVGGAWSGVIVKADNVVEGYDFSDDPTACAAIGVANGKLIFNPAFVEEHAGETIWYVNRDFDPTATGVLGIFRDAGSIPLHLAPVPGPTDFPLLKVGNRKYLTPLFVDTEAALEEHAPLNEGEVLVALSTGRLRFSETDLAKADPTHVQFSKHWYGEHVVCDGLSLSGAPQPTKKPVPLILEDGVFYIPDAVSLPTEFSSDDPYRGLGVSGAISTLDGTGATPTPETEASVRPGGDNLASVTPGRIRQVEDGVGDTILFSSAGALKEVVVVDRESDLPSLFSVAKGTAYVAREKTPDLGSRVLFSLADRSTLGDGEVYFLQASLMPSVWTNKARLLSKTRFVFRFTGEECLYFAIDGTSYLWQAASLPAQDFYTPEEVAASIQDVIGDHVSYAWNGAVVLESENVASGTVEIGWGDDPLTEGDYSGAAALGFLPGWRVKGGVDNWLSDSGVSFGLKRSLVNLDRTLGVADFCDKGRVESVIITDSVIQAPFVFLDNPPLQDVAGIDDGVFFALQTVIEDADGPVIVDRPLGHYEDVVHRFGERKFLWAESDQVQSQVLQPLTTISLGQQRVLPETLLAAPGIGGSLYVSEDGGAFVPQIQNDEYVLPQEGGTGEVLLTATYGSMVASGARGRFTAGSAVFTDPSASFIEPSDEVATNDFGAPLVDADGDLVYLPTVREGYRLKVTSGDAEGSYTIVSVEDGTHLIVDPPFAVTASHSTQWEIRKDYPAQTYNPAIVADQVYLPFNHVQEEPFKVNVLTKLGLMPATIADQATSRLQADMDQAVDRGRLVSLRLGLKAASAETQVSLVPLRKQEVGRLANGSLVLPTMNNSRFENGSFSVQVGSDKFVPDLVIRFSDDPTGVEYLDTGELKFSAAILNDYASASVWFVEEFLNPADLASKEAEYNPDTGELNLSAFDLGLNESVYFVEQMISEQRLDVSLAPISGTIGFNEPVKAGQIIEAVYFLADLEGRKDGEEVQEFIPVDVKSEEAERENDFLFHFNLEGKTLDLGVQPQVYVGAMLQNFGTDEDCTIKLPTQSTSKGRISFIGKPVPSGVPVKVTFSVYEANGGERAYTTSTFPVYRPPFFIKEKQDNFGLRGDRTEEFVPGQMLRVGSECFYVKGVRYFPANGTKGNVTRLDIFPPTAVEVGSRSPGNDAVSFITPGPITTVVDPDGDAVSTDAGAGFMQVIDLTQFPFEPADLGSMALTFQGDLTTFARTDHVLEVGGRPYLVNQAKLSEDGSRTQIKLQAPLRKAVSPVESPTVKLSVRPVYLPEARQFVGVGPVLTTEDYEVVLYTPGLPGRTLVSNVEYALDTNTGSLKLLSPAQDALQPEQVLKLFFTKIRQIGPVLRNGILSIPRYFASFLYNSIPSKENGLLGARLTGTWTYRNPDSFYLTAMPLTKFLGEVVQEALDEIQAQQPQGGPIKSTRVDTANWTRGREGLLAIRRHLLNKDRAVRRLLDFYNTAIVAFEQIEETIDGRFIGDRDGKFKFFVGRGKTYAPPGYEDDITGELTPRNVWGTVFNQENPSLELFFLETDNIVDPEGADLASGELEGSFMPSSRFKELRQNQKALVLNDVDDRVLVKLNKPHVTLDPWPHFKLDVTGKFQRMGASHLFSRLFPTRTRAFLQTSPGAGSDLEADDFGVYTAGRFVDGHWVSTRKDEIGVLTNTTFGELSNVKDVDFSKRRARARIWGYFPHGLPVESGFDVTVPCVVALPQPLADMPIDPDTGFPDSSQLLSLGGALADAASGDPSHFFPGFKTGDQVQWAKPDGSFYPAYFLEMATFFGQQALTGLFVHEVVGGCVITFQDREGNRIEDPSRILVGTEADGGVAAEDFPLSQGDTIYVGPPLSVSADSFDPQSPLTVESLGFAAASADTYRTGFDVGFTSEGQVIDLTLPSKDDFAFLPWKELLGQNPPKPMTMLEADVSFQYTGQNPAQIPALSGVGEDDSGDIQIPYLRSQNTELDRLDIVASKMSTILDANNSGFYLYPDEIVQIDGGIVGVSGVGVPFQGGPFAEAAVLMSQVDPFPHTTDPATPGVGDLAAYDLLLVEAGQGGLAVGSQGWLTIGAVESPSEGFAFIKPPRFVTATTPPSPGTNLTGSPVRYTLTNAQVYLNVTYPVDPQVDPPAGVRLIEDLDAGVTVIDFSDLAEFALNNGLAAGSGNYNSIWSWDVADQRFNNKITLSLYGRDDPNVSDTPGGNPLLGPGVLLYTITFEKGQVKARDWASNTINTVDVDFAGAVEFGVTYTGNNPVVVQNRQIVIHQTGLIDFNAPGAENEWFLPYTTTGNKKESIYGWEFSISVDTFNKDGLDVGASKTAWIGADRLTFNEVIDLRRLQPRGTVHPLNPSTSLAGALVVHEVSIGSSGYGSHVNRDVNGTILGAIPYPFTFLRAGTWAVADVALDPTERGSVEVPAFEGYESTEILGTDVRFAAIPSSPVSALGPIFSGAGYTESKDNVSVVQAWRYDHRLVDLSVADGDLANVEAGDIVTITKAWDLTHHATTKAGTYLVRHVVPETSPGINEVVATTFVGSGSGWVETRFPKVVGFNPDTLELELDAEIDPADFGGYLFVVLDVSLLSDESTFKQGVWRATIDGVVGNTVTLQADLVWADGSDMSGEDIAAQATASVGKRITGFEVLDISVRNVDTTPNSYSVVGQHTVIAQGTAQAGGVASITLAVDESAVDDYFNDMTITLVSGTGENQSATIINYVGATKVVTVDGMWGVVPAADTVYVISQGVPVVHGFRFLTAASGFNDGSFEWSSDKTLPGLIQDAAFDSLTGSVSVEEGTPISNVSFNADPNARVYRNIPARLHLGASLDQFEALNNRVTADSVLQCILPGTKLSTEMGGDPGFQAQAGLFLEPSFPQTGQDLADDHRRLVDAGNSLNADEIGMRNAASYLGVGVTALAQPEGVEFQVRRIRRFHRVLEDITDNLRPLKYAYEIRRGIVSGYEQTPQKFGLLDASFDMTWNETFPALPRVPDVWNTGESGLSGTNLGTFLDADVNIHAGDSVRFLDTTGKVIDTVQIAGVLSESTLLLAQPGLTPEAAALAADGMLRFEVFLRRAPVPQEQSNQQLLDLLTLREVHATLADYDTELGGYVPQPAMGETYADVVNRLYDDLDVDGSPGNTWADRGVRVGDIVLVDPAGTIPQAGDEVGARPVGDRGVPNRLGHVASRPSNLDDNRGFYRIVGIEDTDPRGPCLLVSGACTLAGQDVVFGGTDDRIQYALLPTVHDSTLSDSGDEGQMDLRPTAPRIAGGYESNNFSIRPFSYRIVRPSKLFSKEATDLILMTRERMLSWIEELYVSVRGHKSGSYWVFQRDLHAYDVGDPVDPTDGLGVMSNLFVLSLIGEVGVSPYMNSSDCLSILDRRFWIHDTRLDSLRPKTTVASQLASGGPAFPEADGPYTAYTDAALGANVRPVLPDRIDQVLDKRDLFRQIRYVWLAYRTNTMRGTLTRIDQFDRELAQRLEEQKKQALLQYVMDKLNDT